MWNAACENASVPPALQVERYAARHAEIMEVAASVFADAGDEFATLAGVKQRLEEFKELWVGPLAALEPRRPLLSLSDTTAGASVGACSGGLFLIFGREGKRGVLGRTK